VRRWATRYAPAPTSQEHEADEAVDQILECYRLRWQIELVFKRMKSILGVGHLPKTDPLGARAWLEGKIFVGLLIERMIHTAEAISPWGYTLAAPPQPMARN
jgi:hypothetical protein